MRMTRKGLMTAVVVVSSAFPGVLASAAQASPVGSQGLVPTTGWDCVDANGNEYTANVSLPAAFNAPVPAGQARRRIPGILTSYIPANAGEPALPLGPYQVLTGSNGNKNGAVSGTLLFCTNQALGVTSPLTVAHAGS